MSHLVRVACVVLLASCSTLALGQAKKKTKAELDLDKAVESALERGVAFLKDDPARRQFNLSYRTGGQTLTALALLEAGVDPKDEVIQDTAALVRSSLGLRKTYELSLAVLFLDRLGDKADEALIRSFALRLIAGQNGRGGWSYSCPVLTEPQEELLLTFLRKNQPMPHPLAPPRHAFLVPLGRPGTELPIPLPQTPLSLRNPLDKKAEDLLRQIPISEKDRSPLREPLPNLERTPAGAKPDDKDPKPSPRERLKALAPPAPAAGKKPAETPTPSAPAKKADAVAAKDAAGKGGAGKPGKVDPATWPSVPDFVEQNLGRQSLIGKERFGDNSNTQFAILALWASRRHDVPMALSLAALDKRFRETQHPDGSWGYIAPVPTRLDTMTCVGLLGLGASHGSFREAMRIEPKEPFVDPAMQRGMKALGNHVRASVNDQRLNIYLLWSVERVAVMYNLNKIEGVDWFTWGARPLLKLQRADGGWHTQGYFGSQAGSDTAMALLFLSRSHLNRDLTDRLKGFIHIGPK